MPRISTEMCLGLEAGLATPAWVIVPGSPRRISYLSGIDSVAGWRKFLSGRSVLPIFPNIAGGLGSVEVVDPEPPQMG